MKSAPKVFVLAPREDWIVDRMVEEWYQHNQDMSVKDPKDADIIWLLADWCWDQIPIELLRQKKVVVTVWHLVPEKLNQEAKALLRTRDALVDVYHAPSVWSEKQIRSVLVTSKPIVQVLPWVNQNLWRTLPAEERHTLREKFGLSADSFVIGSFQRDTEGKDLISPKLEKGPDRFCDAVIRRRDSTTQKVEVLLGGWRRQYVMGRLTEAGIPYRYIEKASQDILNEMYNTLDLYIVGSRYEGGPQSIVECACTRVPIISTDVGLAPQILASDAIFEPGNDLLAVPDVEHAWNKVKDLFIPQGFNPFREMISSL